MPRIRYNCSVSILHPATPQCQIPILWWFPGTCFLPPVFQLWIWCLFEFALSILYPDLTTDSSLALQLCPWVWLKSYARFLQILSSGWAVFQKGNNILPQASPWFFPTTQATLDSSSEPRPGIWPAWFSKDSALPGELHDKNELTLTQWGTCLGKGVEILLEISARGSLIPAPNRDRRQKECAHFSPLDMLVSLAYMPSSIPGFPATSPETLLNLLGTSLSQLGPWTFSFNINCL